MQRGRSITSPRACTPIRGDTPPPAPQHMIPADAFLLQFLLFFGKPCREMAREERREGHGMRYGLRVRG